MRILVVEDHGDSADLLARVLRGAGHEVLTAATAAEALAACATRVYDLLISDIGLPDCDGWELLRRVRERHVLRAIAVSAFGAPADLERSRRAGFEIHLVKPISFERLTDAVAALAAPPPPAGPPR